MTTPQQLIARARELPAVGVLEAYHPGHTDQWRVRRGTAGNCWNDIAIGLSQEDAHAFVDVHALLPELADALESVTRERDEATAKQSELQATIDALKKSDTGHRRRIAADALELERLRANQCEEES